MSVTSVDSKVNQSLVWAYNNGYKFIDGKIYGPKGLALKLNINSTGYYYFGVNPPFLNRVVSIPLHRFIGYLKFGNRIFSTEMVIRHLDNIKTNNSWDNIDGFSEAVIDFVREIEAFNNKYGKI